MDKVEILTLQDNYIEITRWTTETSLKVQPAKTRNSSLILQEHVFSVIKTTGGHKHTLH
jgi:hypothetical protein